MPSPPDVTLLLVQMREGNDAALEQLMPLVYDELRAMAHNRLRHERPGHTLSTTGLVHEAYLRLAAQQDVQWQNRAHFFAIAAQAMRRILVNYAEKHTAQKRGGGAPKVPLDDALAQAPGLFSDAQAEELLLLNDAMNRLESFNERGCRVVEYRYFGGLTHDEIAEVMNLSKSSVRRAWQASKVWLKREMATV